MYLTQALVTTEGVRRPMVGLVPAEAHMRDRLQALGYVEVETQTRTILGAAGTRFRGHQFRYSELSPAPDPSSIRARVLGAQASRKRDVPRGLPDEERRRVVRTRALGFQSERAGGARPGVRRFGEEHAGASR